MNGRLKGKSVSKNVVNLSKGKLSKFQISLLPKGLKFISTCNTIDQAKLKIELEAYGRMLRLKWFFWNDEKEFNPDKFKPNSTFNPRNKDAAIEICLSSLEEKPMSTEIPKDKCNNLTREERGADKGSAVVVWDRDDYIQEAEKQLGDKEIYQEVINDPQPLIDTRAVEKIRKRGDLSADNIKCFMIKFPRFYLLPKIHKTLENVPGRPVISNCGFYTENISAFLDFHLQPLVRDVKSYVKDTNDFFKKTPLLDKLT